MKFKRIMETADWKALCSQDMDFLNDILGGFFDEAEKEMPELVEHTLFKVEMAVSVKFSKESAEYIVKGFKNKDGSKGEHWEYEETRAVLKDTGLEYDCSSWYYAMNFVYCKLYDSQKTLEDYIDHAKDFMVLTEFNPKKFYIAEKCFK